MDQSDLFRVGLTNDGVYHKTMNVPSAVGMLEDQPKVIYKRCPVEVDPIPQEVLDRFDVVVAGGPRFTPETVAGTARCSLIVRFGAGYDRVDLDACTEAGIIVATTPEGVRRPMATAALTHILVLSTRFVHKSRCAHENRWDIAHTDDEMGLGLKGSTVGFIGFGSIGKDLYALITPFEMRHLVYDPYLDQETASGFNIEKTDLTTLLTESDIVVVLCALTPETHHLIDSKAFGLMKPSCYFVNIARGGIVDQRALATALSEGHIRGAGLDALDPEPIHPDDPLLALDNVHITPHAMGLTDEMQRLCSEKCVQAALDVMRGNRPESVINRAVLDEQKLKTKLQRYRDQFS